MNIIDIPQTSSTNTLMAQMDSQTPLPHATIVRALAQTAGRGQRGNSWESEPGQNLTFSMLLRPAGVDAAAQFFISEAVALGVADTLAELLSDHPEAGEVAVKWPNDIYVGNRKICGILIENTLTGRTIDRSIAGIGVNVNQQLFVSDAPNPVSLTQLTGRRYELRPLLENIGAAIEANMAEDPGQIHSRYIARLWRREGLHPYTITDTGTRIMARIAGIEPTGRIILAHADGTTAPYAFKEIAALLNYNS